MDREDLAKLGRDGAAASWRWASRTETATLAHLRSLLITTRSQPSDLAASGNTTRRPTKPQEAGGNASYFKVEARRLRSLTTEGPGPGL
jgi:hypothetical protein